ncbi:MAG: zf-HC2 domain-containing protein [bacterium]|nr:zf-HC2 domain-containing protein [bacterium]
MDLQDLEHDDCDLRACVRALTADARRTLEAHPSTDALLRYHERALGPEEAEAVRDHLALCPECARRGLDLAGFLQTEPDVGDEDLSADAGPPDWHTTRQALVREGLLEEPRSARRRVIELLRTPRLAYAMAALFFVTSVALALWLAMVHGTLGELAQPRANVQLFDLYENSGAQRDQSSAPPAIAAAPGDSPVLILNLLDRSYPGYRVEIADPDGRVIWSSGALERSPDDDYTVQVPRRRLPAEHYLVRLYVTEGSREHPLADYTLRFQPQPP